MPHISYLTRRGAVYYIQIRLPRLFSGKSVLARFSIGTSDHRTARQVLVWYLSWMMPMKNAASVERLVETMCLQLHAFLRAGSAENEHEARHRLVFAAQIERYLDEWAAADPDPVEYAPLYRRWAELKEGHLALVTLAERDLIRLKIDPAGSTALASYKPRIINEFEKSPRRVPTPEEFDLAEGGAYTFGPDELWFDPAGCKSNDQFARYLSVDKSDEELAHGFLERFHRDDQAMPQPTAFGLHRAGVGLPAHQIPSGMSPQGITAWPMSKVLKRFLASAEKVKGDGSAESEVGPIVRFAIKLLGDPIMAALSGEQMLELKEEMAEIPTLKGFSPNERDDLYFRYSEAKKHNFKRVRNGVEIKLTRVSKSTLTGRYKVGLTRFFEWAIENKFAQGPVPNFTFKTVKNPGKAKRDAFRHEELVAFLSTPLFTGCKSKSHPWKAGDCFFQSFFYWTTLITLLCGLRPGETAQFRCRDVLDFQGKPHFRFAKHSDADDEDIDGARPGGNQAKSPNAFRWIPIHPLLLQLGLLERRDAILAAYIEKETKAAKKPISTAGLQAITDEAEEQWLFPDWKVYVRSTGLIQWSHAVTKVWQYAQTKFGFDRNGVTLYSARHTYIGFIDELEGLSERSKRVITGHSTEYDVHSGYGPKRITEEQMEVALKLDNKTIQAMSEILLAARRKAVAGELRIIEAWKIDQRSGDKVFQKALAIKSEQYR